ncbi:MAG: glycine cleavage system aminomethyltransferase GcvT [Mycobacteriales bacterium]
MTDAPSMLDRSPLHDRHVALGAKMADFGGWEMPIEYAASGGGVVKEHTAVRTAVGVFDVSHLGTATVRGPGAAGFVNSCLTADLGKIGPGRAKYTMCCDDNGGVVDDLITYLIGPEDILLVPNAANNAEVVSRLTSAAPDDVEVANIHHDRAVIAVQGPRSAAVLDAAGLPSGHDYMSFVRADGVIVCRTGYTGEHGYELVVPSADAHAIWDRLIAASPAPTPCGLGARDTLRTEMGYPLHGHELSLEITPVQARAGWAVGWAKPAFWGRAALSEERAAKPRRRLRGLRSDARGIPRPGMAAYVGDEAVGVITSGTFSPTLRCGIGLALIDRGTVVDGDTVDVDIRGRRGAMVVTKPPFVPDHTRSPVVPPARIP